MNSKDFKNPNVIFRPGPFWSWNDKLESKELRRQIKEMAKKGWGSYFMHSRVGLVTEYLSDDWMEKISECVDEAKKTNTLAWLYDEDKWPSGYAGGIVPLKDESYRSKALIFIKSKDITKNDTVIVKVEYQGEDYSICSRIDTLGNKVFNKTSYVDLMNPNAVKAFIESTHEKYKRHLFEHFGKEIPGIFTDEPCYLMENHYSVPCIPWSEYLKEYIMDKKGYNIEDHVDKLFLDKDDYKKIRYDYYECATLLFKESFTKQYYDWCDENNLKMTGHFMAEDNLVYQTQWIGAAMPHYEFMHWPGIDKLARHLEQVVTCKQLTSVTDQLNKERALSEVFGCIGQQSSFFERKWIGDWQGALGVNFVNHHLSLYSMRGERKRDYPANLFYQQPWWEDEKNFADYTTRLCYSLTGGTRELDILIIHPSGSVWSEYSPLHAQNDFMTENSLYNAPFEKLSKELIYSNFDYHYGDELLMEKYASVVDGKIKIGDYEYTTVIVPPNYKLRDNTIDLLNKVDKNNLIFYNSDSSIVDKKSMQVNNMSNLISILDKKYSSRIKIIDKMTNKPTSKILCHSRIFEDGKNIFFANTQDTRTIKASIVLPDVEKGFIIDLNNGKIYDAPIFNKKIEVTFHPAGSLMLSTVDSLSSDAPLPYSLSSAVSFENDFSIKKSMYDFNIEITDDNVLPIQKATLFLDGKKIIEDDYIAKAWHDHFYKAKNNTPFKAEYKFYIRHIPDTEVFAAVEMAENLDLITINGKEVKPLKEKGELSAFSEEKSFLDVNFTKIPLDNNLKEGLNTLVIEGKKVNNITGPGTHEKVNDTKNHYPTEFETVYIFGNFKVTGYNNEVFEISNDPIPVFHNELTYNGYPFYAGKAKFTANFDFSKNEYKGKKIYAYLDGVKCASLKISINHNDLEVKYYKPYIYDITKYLEAGENLLEISMANTLFNLMGPNNVDKILDIEGVSPHTFLQFDRMDDEFKLLTFGLHALHLLEEK